MEFQQQVELFFHLVISFQSLFFDILFYCLVLYASLQIELRYYLQ